MKTISFCKMQGAGNDFIIIEGSALNKNRKNFVKKICNRHFGIGADGVVFLDRPKNKENHFCWDFYNSDGSSAEACMNASRCVVKYVSVYWKAKGVIRFESVSGVVRGMVQKEQVQLELSKGNDAPERVTVECEGKQIKGYFMNTGVPHFVVHEKKWTPHLWTNLAKTIQEHKYFGSKKTNVTFFRTKTLNKIQAITFERGVCNWTLACGTGAVAAAQVQLFLRGGRSIEIEMPGGVLQFTLDKQENYLKGPAKIVYNGKIRNEEKI